MSWNYRVVRTTSPFPVDGEQPHWFAIHEAYYDAEGGITAITERPVAFESDSIQGLQQLRLMMFEALKRPTLIHEDLPWVVKESHGEEVAR